MIIDEEMQKTNTPSLLKNLPTTMDPILQNDTNNAFGSSIHTTWGTS
jgi:hypothetical protein